MMLSLTETMMSWIPPVAASDAAMIDEVIEAIEEGGRLPPLNRTELNLGRFSISKVLHLICVYLFSDNCIFIDSSRIWL